MLILALGGSVSSRVWSQDDPGKKPDEKKVDDKKADDKKADDKKVDDKKVDDKKVDDKKVDDKKPAGPKAEAWAKEFAGWKDRLKKLRDLATKYSIAEPAEAEGIRKQYGEVIEAGKKSIPALRAAAIAAYTESPNEDRELTKFLLKLAGDDIRQDLYDDAAPLLKLLQDNKCSEKGIENMAGIVAFVTNDYDSAEKLLEAAKADGTITDQATKYLGDIPDYKKYWVTESELRKKEADAKDPLPRVKMTTSAGDILIELFENEAPETVGNFVSLVEGKFYDGLLFHRVLPGFMAQGGDPAGDGSGGPKYEIFCECGAANARMHFRGSLSMAHRGPNTGGSQFFLTFVPTSHLNKRHTVFGRVVEGMDVLGKLKRREPDPSKPDAPGDKILKAEVVRKRDHKYVPHKVEGSGPADPAAEKKPTDKKTEEKKVEEKKVEEKKVEEKKTEEKKTEEKKTEEKKTEEKKTEEKKTEEKKTEEKKTEEKKDENKETK